ncbi:MAG: hypothetical protein O2967_10615, partial [Proteobacteria bacterium]|nr:hypothetical protein [Pseudomonadota bacterium]
QQQVNLIRRFFSNAQTPDSMITPVICDRLPRDAKNISRHSVAAADSDDFLICRNSLRHALANRHNSLRRPGAILAGNGLYLGHVRSIRFRTNDASARVG